MTTDWQESFEVFKKIVEEGIDPRLQALEKDRTWVTFLTALNLFFQTWKEIRGEELTSRDLLRFEVYREWYGGKEFREVCPPATAEAIDAWPNSDIELQACMGEDLLKYWATYGRDVFLSEEGRKKLDQYRIERGVAVGQLTLENAMRYHFDMEKEWIEQEGLTERVPEARELAFKKTDELTTWWLEKE